MVKLVILGGNPVTKKIKVPLWPIIGKAEEKNSEHMDLYSAA